MWEIALLVIAIGFAVLVVFIVPVLLQLRDSAKELEFTLREARETLHRVRDLSEKAEVIVDKSRTVVEGAAKAVAALDGIVGKAGANAITRTLSVALEVFPLAMTARKLIQKFRKEA